MKVRELIAILEKHNPEQEIIASGCYGSIGEIFQIVECPVKDSNYVSKHVITTEKTFLLIQTDICSG